MSTLASLAGMLGQMPNIRPWDVATRSQNEADTGLIQLADLKAKQAAEQQYLLSVQNDPRVREALFGGSVLGSIGPAGGPPGAAPMTQQTTMPGQPPSAPTVVPGGQDLSRYANVSPQGGGPIPADVMGQVMPTVTPPQSILASLGPQPQGGMPGPQNPVLEMARRDPRAAMMLQQQLQQAQKQQWDMQEKRLDWGVKISEYVARMLQGVTDQASLDDAREKIRQVHPQAAAQVPQMYSKEAVASVQQRGIAIADRAKNLYDEARARKADMETQMFPELVKRFGTDGTEQPAAGGAAAPRTDTQARPAPPEFETAITDANRLYPQVSTTRIKSIIAAESNFDPKAVSSAGAQGPMQLMPGTAKDMGVADPFNVQQNVLGGTRYYAQMLEKYGGDERKALAAYNWGPGNLDKVGGDVTKAPAETQAYVNRVLGGGRGGTTSIAQAPTADPRIAQLERQIASKTNDAKIASLMGNESLSTRLNDEANRLQAEKVRLEAPGQELAKQTVLQPGVLEQQRAGAQVQLEADMNKPIGTENAIKMDLPAETKWKDVPKGTKVLDRPGEGVATKLGEYKSSHDGIARVIGMLDQPGATSIVGTLFSEPDASFRRRAGEWISSVTPQERKFAAAMVAEVASIRHALAGSAVSPEEAAFVKEMMPKTSDPDVGTVRAKLEVLQEWVATKHEGMRDQLEQMRFRAPKALPRSASTQPSSGLTPDQQRLLDKHTTR